MLVDDDLRREAFIVRFDAQGSLPAVQGILLNEVYTVHPNNLQNKPICCNMTYRAESS